MTTSAAPRDQPAVTLLKGDAAALEFLLFPKGGVACVVVSGKINDSQRRLVERFIPHGSYDLEAVQRWGVHFVWHDPHFPLPVQRPEPPFTFQMFFGG